MTCEHMDFEAYVEVTRLTPTEETEEVTSFTADITVKCAECGAAFGFKGPRAGYSFKEPRVDVRATMLHAPLMSPTELELAGPTPGASRGPVMFEMPPSTKGPDAAT